MLDTNVALAQPARQKTYAFEGDVIRLTDNDFIKWRQFYSAIPDLVAVLATADAYYACNPPRDGKWYIPVRAWLLRENEKAMKQKKVAAYGTDWW